MNREKYSKNKIWRRMVCLLVATIGVAVFLQAGILNSVNTRSTNKTSKVLLNQAIGIIEKNQQNEKDMIQSLKEDYIVRAKAVAYILDAKPEAERDVEELQKIADLMSIDEIHLFNTGGTIYSGTIPKYYGYGLGSGEQMAYFKPMLSDKSLTMCQDVTPNTSEKKNMMYAMTWNEAGNKLIQVGIEPVRLLQEVKQNEISTIVSNMPMYEGISIYVADKDSGEIYGATDEKKIGQTLDEAGIPKEKITADKTVTATLYIDGARYQCIFEQSGDYVAGVLFAVAADNESNLIAILIVAVYLLIAGAGIMFLIGRLVKANQEKREQFAVLSSMAEIYYSMHLVNLPGNYVIEYSGQTNEKEMGKSFKNANEMLRQLIGNLSMEVYREQSEAFVNLETVAERMKGKKIISGEFVGKELGWFRASFIAIETEKDEKPVKVIFTIQSIDDEKRKEEKLIHTSNTDQLTGCYNRRAYEKDVMELDLNNGKEFIYMSMDVNGLKIVNDCLGHAAGDELLEGASSCMKKCFDDYGKVYRIGGDEFICILFTDPERFEEVYAHFEETVDNWRGQWISSMTISSGYVSSKEKKWESIREMAQTSDERMYERKAMYYRKNGVDRRGQPAAYVAICKLYAKIIKINLTDNSYRILNWEDERVTPDMIPVHTIGENLEVMLKNLEDPGNIHVDDREEYKKQTDLEYLKQYFDKGNQSISISYRKREKNEYRRMTIEIVRADDYTEDSRNAFMYVKG